MKKTDFDAYSGDYNAILQKQLQFFDDDEGYFAEYKVLLTKQLWLSSTKTLPKTILDFGCGIGRSLPYFHKHFPQADLYGTDPSALSLTFAKSQCHFARFLSAEELCIEPMTFDCIFLAGVLHHIPLAERNAVFSQLHSLLSPQGRLVIFEHNPYNPVTRYLVNTCPFDEDAVLLTARETRQHLLQAGFVNPTLHYTLFFPTQLRWLRPLEKYLRWLPLGGQFVAMSSHCAKVCHILT